MAKKVNERDIQRKVILSAQLLKIPVIRLSMGAGISTGWPDVIFLIPGGKPLFIEFKAPGKKVKANSRQARAIKTLLQLGYEAHECNDADNGYELIKQALDAARLSKEGG